VLGPSFPSDAGAFVTILDWFALAVAEALPDLKAWAESHREVRLSPAQVLDRLLWFDSEGSRHFAAETARTAAAGTVEGGLCTDCQHTRVVESARGSQFRFCSLHERDARFAKYPRLPVVSCDGYSRAATRDPPQGASTRGSPR
jgi:hypothetical protein